MLEEYGGGKRTDGDGPENESAGGLFATLSTGRRSAAVDLETIFTAHFSTQQ